jgi:hypothetical protein
MTDTSNIAATEAADETTPRDSAPVIADFHGDEDPDSEVVLRALLAAGADAKGVQA